MKNIIIIALITLITYSSSDFIYSKIKGDFNISFMSKNCIKNSIFFGYEYFKNNNCRYKRIMKGQLQYDNEFKTNNFGFVSHFDYELTKKNQNKKRAVVLGYSMAEGNYIPTNWPSAASDSTIEFYNFARAGYFNLNLQRLYFNVIKNFNFDYLLLPKIGTTDRQFMIFESRENGTFDGLFTNIPGSEDDYQNNYKSRLNLMYKYFSSEQNKGLFDDLIITKKNVDLFKRNFRMMGRKETSQFKKVRFNNELLNQYPQGLVDLIGERNINIYLKVIDHSLSNNAKIVFYQDPNKGESPEDSQKDLTYQLYTWLRGLYPERFYYFDGNDAFRNEGISNTRPYYFKLDGHWNQKGSNIFARQISKFIKSI